MGVIGMIGGLSFAAPLAGALALLGIPAVVAIHFLQLPARPVPVSTLFLLERLDPKSLGGSRLQSLRQSVPLWLQLLAVLLIAWLLAQPRWMRPDSTQTVLVLLDSSVSMRAFADPLKARLPAKLRALEAAAAATEWLLLETDPAAGRLYSGGSLAELEKALDGWRPRLGTHDFERPLRQAQALVRDRGLVIFVSDRATAVPPGVELFAVGTPLENAGFAGAVANADGWEALIKNYGSRPQTRAWWMEARDGQRSPEQKLTLQPGQSEIVRGRYPEGGGPLRLRLGKAAGDPFEMDDSLPLVRPEPKRVRVRAEAFEKSGLFGEWLDAFFRSEKGLDRVTENPDLEIALYDPLAPRLPAGPAIVFIREPGPASKLLKGMIVAERDPLLSGLSWDGLLAAESFGFPPKPGDAVLLWQGDRPLISRRGPQLLLGFDPARSNAARLPAFVLLVHRFLESVRASLPVPETANFETNQALPVVSKTEGKPLRVRTEERRPLPGSKEDGQAGADPDPEAGGLIPRAPAEPGYFEVLEGTGTRLTGAAHFADAREADFSGAASLDTIEAAVRRQLERHSSQDGLTPVWVLLLGAVLVVNWNWRERR